MPSLIHLLTPDPPPLTTVVCGDPSAASATWDRAQVTCPACQPPARARQASSLSEKQFMAVVTQALTRGTWMYFHPYDSRRSVAGFPDLLALRWDATPRLLVAELKRVGGTPTQAQARWLEAFRQIPGVEVYVWTPDDLATILEVLR